MSQAKDQTNPVSKYVKDETFQLKDLLSDGGPLRMVLRATLTPVAGLDRFQPAGFPEIGHVMYDAPRRHDKGSEMEKVCIVDSAASMANHLESVCRSAPHDPDVSPELDGMPYLRCVTDPGWPNHSTEANKNESKQVVVTSLTEGHRIASTYFLEGKRVTNSKDGVFKTAHHAFKQELATECGVLDTLGKKAHPPAEAWWTVFRTMFRYDPNALVHGLMFPQWQIKIPRMLTAHLEAFGAGRVDRSGVKFDRLGKTTSGQPIFAVDDATAREIRATFILDLALVRSFGREAAGTKQSVTVLGLNSAQKEFLVALALWKIGRLLSGPFRYRSGCDLECKQVDWDGVDVHAALTSIGIRDAIKAAAFTPPTKTDIYWTADDLYREGAEETKAAEHAADAPDDDDEG